MACLAAILARRIYREALVLPITLLPKRHDAGLRMISEALPMAFRDAAELRLFTLPSACDADAFLPIIGNFAGYLHGFLALRRYDASAFVYAIFDDAEIYFRLRLPHSLRRRAI